MKKFITTSLLVMSASVLFSGISFAKGRAIIPSYVSYQMSASFYDNLFFISNTTSTAIEVKIKLYRKANSGETPPVLLLDPHNSRSSGLLRLDTGGADYSEATPNYSATFRLSPYETAEFYINQSANCSGWGIIEWTSSDTNLTEAIVAHGSIRLTVPATSTYNYYAVPINGGLKF